MALVTKPNIVLVKKPVIKATPAAASTNVVPFSKPALIGGAPRKLVDKAVLVQKFMNQKVLERERETHGILVSLLSQTSMFFYGDVGTSKTRHIRFASKLCGLSMFDKQISETTKPQELFGPDDIPALATEGIQRQKLEGYAAAVDVVFLDEAFKASGIVLNPLLQLVNEREFRNGDEGMIKTPLKTTFVASNEIPTDEVLKAFYDRLLIRYEVDDIKTHSNLRKMVEMNLTPPTPIPQILTRDETLSLMDMIFEVKVPHEIMDTAIKIREQIQATLSSRISDRRFATAFAPIRANAILRGKRLVEGADLEILSHIFWDKPENANKVASIVMGHVSAEAADLYSYVEIAESVATTGLSTGNIDEAVVKLRSLYKKTKGFSTQAGKQISRTILGRLQEFKNIQDRRAGFILLKVVHDGKITYKIATASATVWTQDQLRSCGFKWRRKGQYWYADTSGKSLTTTIQNKLGVDVTIKKVKA